MMYFAFEKYVYQDEILLTNRVELTLRMDSYIIFNFFISECYYLFSTLKTKHSKVAFIF